ncbi:hypothetical protein S83_012509, partial [Arachis hypogaea]
MKDGVRRFESESLGRFYFYEEGNSNLKAKESLLQCREMLIIEMNIWLRTAFAYGQTSSGKTFTMN